eukprot:2874257-Alexandrium_andersonii.AAC.1
MPLGDIRGSDDRRQTTWRHLHQRHRRLQQAGPRASFATQATSPGRACARPSSCAYARGHTSERKAME